MALSDQQLQVRMEGEKHVMLSYQWDHQTLMQRIHDSLLSRGYLTWFDLQNM